MYAAEPYLVFNPTKSAHPPFILSDDKKYTVAKVARQRLMVESSFRDHDLRRLVGHANLVDKFTEEYASRDPNYSITCIKTMEKKSSKPHERYVLQAEKTTILPARKPEICTISREVSTTTCTEVAVEEYEVSENDD